MSLLLRLYGLAMVLAAPLYRRYLRRRALSEPGYAESMHERFGRYNQQPSHGFVWVHAVSLGETRAAAVLIPALRAQMPGMRLLLTHGTATGRAEGAKLLLPGDVQVWQPWDSPGVVERFVQQFAPRLGVLMETEVWPTMVAVCRKRAVPLVLVNARLSEKSLQSALRLAWLARPSYAALQAVFAQSDADADRFKQLGAPVRGVLGNLKYDATPNGQHLARGRAWRARSKRPVVLFASSRDGEEVALLDRLSSLKNGAQTVAGHASVDRDLIASVDLYTGDDAALHAVQWLIVPRHPQRFPMVEALISAHGFGVSRRSTWSEQGPPESVTGQAADGGAWSIWLGDSLGEMALYYGMADVALLGGSFEPLGGQNLIEAAACDCPVVMGPHTFNFAEASGQAAEVGAALRVESLDQAVMVAQQLVQNTVELSQTRAACTRFVAAHRGATERTVQALTQWL